ncbi:flavodoxin [Oceanispirochaeta crateris]|uniref:Flavodoxin n=1 Tax=Oceanispirochaeta crateris TaxID=2518645 RepID=A0A5C1QMY9_9SPIO|nr:flavodoxin [Oceanispirochaeta crateris]QEN09041.1 flavodoxin [Oceanispirochaeta crateris]
MTAVVYGSSTGNTEEVAGKTAAALGNADVLAVSDCDADKLKGYDRLILGTSTWGIGDLQDDWDEKLEILSQLDYSGKTVALFGLGDQEGYSDSFVDAMAPLKKEILAAGGTLKGKWPVEGYEFSSSASVEDDSFIGLALDEDNQSNLTDERIKLWVSSL